MQKAFLIAAGLVSVSTGVAVHAQDGQALGQMDGVSIVLPADFSCRENVHIHLNAESTSPFADEPLMSRLAGQLQALMSFDCAEARNIRMLGFVDGSEVYRAQTSVSADWSVLTMLSPEDAGAIPSVGENNSSRSTFAGLPSLPASGEPNPINEVADTSGSHDTDISGDDVIERVAGIGTGTGAKSGARQPKTASQAVFDVSEFGQPRIMEALYHGRLDDIRVEGFGQTNISNVNSAFFYLASFNETFPSFRFRDPECITLPNPQVARALQSKVLSNAMGRDLNMGIGSGQVPTAGFEAIGNMFQMLNEGGIGSIVAMEQAMATLKQTGARDAAVLVNQQGGCGSAAVQRIYANIEAFALSKPPVLSETEQARQKKEQQEAEARRRAEEKRRAQQAEQQRQTALRTTAQGQCNHAFRDTDFCSCIVAKLDEMEIDESDWRALGRDFNEVLTVGARQENFRLHLRSCRS